MQNRADINDNRNVIESETTYKGGAGVKMGGEQIAEEAGRIGRSK